MLTKLQLVLLIVALAILFIVIPLIFVVLKKWNNLRKYALKMFHVAEATIRGTKAGQERFKYVLDALYSTLIAPPLQPFITRDMVAGWLQKWYNEIKELLEYIPPNTPVDNIETSYRYGQKIE